MEELSVKIQSLSFSIKSQEILKEIDIAIKKYQFVGLVGPNGSGKTTLLKMINRLEDNTTGEVKINGKNVKEYNIHKMRWDIGYALQQVALFPHMNVEENIAIVPELKKWKKEKINARIDELLNMVGLEPEKYRKRKPSELSGGEAQRVGIARALAVNPKIIFADEPTGNLDTKTTSEVLDLMREIVRTQKQTLIMVTHDPVIANFADRQIKIVDGKISN